MLVGLRRVVAHSQPTTRIGAVLQGQRDADRQMCDGVVVAQLRPGDRDEPVGDHRLAVLHSLAEPVRLDDGGDDGHHQRAARHPGGDRGGGGPAGVHQRLGQRAGHPEGEGGADGEQQAEPEVIDACALVELGLGHLAPPACNE
jgi:hypothetical protein